MSELFDLTGKTALVAGGAGYLAGPACRALAELGARIVIADLARDRAEALAKELPDALAVHLDIANESSIAEAVDAVGALDIMVNATYMSIGKTVEELSAAEFDRTNRVNITSAFLLARAAAEAMPRGGSMIFFSSIYGQVAPDPRIYEPPMIPNPIEYGVAKAGVIQMAKYLAVYWAPRGIRVNVVSPGPFPHERTQTEHPDFMTRLADRVPLGRVGRQEELAGALAYLASPASSYVTGTVLDVDGGWTTW